MNNPRFFPVEHGVEFLRRASAVKVFHSCSGRRYFLICAVAQKILSHLAFLSLSLSLLTSSPVSFIRLVLLLRVKDKNPICSKAQELNFSFLVLSFSPEACEVSLVSPFLSILVTVLLMFSCRFLNKIKHDVVTEAADGTEERKSESLISFVFFFFFLKGYY